MRVLICFFIFVSTVAHAGYSYDYKSGNSYNTFNNGNSITTNGYNFQTGNSWSQTNNSNGTYRGRDSNGNHYSGDNKTGHYINYGTGKTCYGKGLYRTCN